MLVFTIDDVFWIAGIVIGIVFATIIHIDRSKSSTK